MIYLKLKLGNYIWAVHFLKMSRTT